MADIEADSKSTAFVCNLGVMNQEERARYVALSCKLMGASEERREGTEFERCWSNMDSAMVYLDADFEC